MTSQAQMLIRDLLFINYAVDAERLRPFVPAELALDTVTDGRGRAVAFVSAVPFHIASARTSLLPLPSLSFDQINYRAYVDAGEGPAVYFFDMRVSSRLVSAAASIARVPIAYEEISLATAPVQAGAGAATDVDGDPAPYSLRSTVRSSGPQGLVVDVTIGGRHATVGPEDTAIPTGFITERPVGYITAANNSLFRIEVAHAEMRAISARVEQARAPLLESLGVLNMDEIAAPHSALYVREVSMDLNIPTPKKS
jgi:hypothetical protein